MTEIVIRMVAIAAVSLWAISEYRLIRRSRQVKREGQW